MNWVDIAIVVVVFVSTFVGLRTGIIKMALSLAGLVVGIMLAGRYYLWLAGYLAFIHQERIAQGIAFIVILAAVMVVASLLAMILRGIVSALMLAWVDRFGGAFVGFVEGATFVAALLALWIKFPGAPDAIKTSSLAATLLNRFPAVLALLPHEFDAIRSFFQ